MPIQFIRMQTKQKANREALAKGVVGVECVFAGASNTFDYITPEQHEFIAEMLLPDETLGTLEAYANDAWNVYIRRGGMVVGFFRYRKDGS